MTAATYGELMHAGVLAVARAAASPMRVGTSDDVLDVAVAINAVRRALCRQLELAVDHRSTSRVDGRLPRALVDFATALQPSWSPGTLPERPRTDRTRHWWQAAEYIGAAADLLATHLGCHRQPLTPDGQLLSNPVGRLEVGGRVADIATTLADVAVHLARRASTNPTVADPAARAVVIGWFDRGLHVAGTARQLLANAPDPTDAPAVEAMTTAPLLRAEPVTCLEDVVHALGRLQRLATAQSYGDAHADAVTLRGYAALGHTITGHAWMVHRSLAQHADSPPPEIAGAARGRHHRLAEMFLQAHHAWGGLHGALADVRSVGGHPRGWRADIEGIRDQLTQLTRTEDGCREPAVHRFARALPQLADAHTVTAVRLFRTGQLYVPTATVEDADIPRPYTRIPADRFDSLLDRYHATTAASQRSIDATATDRDRRGPPANRRADREQRVGPGQASERDVRRRPRR